uniref:Gustatory receptor n=1 Tax=Musca domestica TaxID=7370 RepID=A0A1I8MIR2_MUSDO
MSFAVPVQKTPWHKRLFRKLCTSPNYYKSMQPMFWTTFVSGVTPFRIASLPNGAKYLKTSCFGYLNLFVHFILMAYCYAYTMLHNESVVGYLLSTKVSKYGNYLHVCIGVMGATILPVAAIIRKKTLEKSFNIYLEVDRHFDQIHVGLDYSQILRYVLFVLSLVAIFDCTITVICIYCLNSISVYPSPCLIFIAVAEVLGISVTISLFCAMVRSAQRRLRRLNWNELRLGVDYRSASQSSQYSWEMLPSLFD